MVIAADPEDLSTDIVKTPGTDPVDVVAARQDVETQLSRFFSRWRDELRRASACLHPGIQPAAYHLVLALYKHGAMRSSMLAETMELDRSMVSRLVQPLEDLGLVERLPDPADGRVHVLALTDVGQARMAEVRAAREGHVHALLSDWPQDDVVKLGELLGRLNAAMVEKP